MKLEITKPEIHAKTWGRELWIANSEKYCGKILEINPNMGFSVHYHVIKDETFYVLDDGLVLFGIDSETAEKYHKDLKIGDVIYINPGMSHQLWNFGDRPARIVEVSTQHFDSDSYRIQREALL